MQKKSVKFKLAFWSVLCVIGVLIGDRFLGTYATYSFFRAHHKEAVLDHMQLATTALKDPIRDLDYIALNNHAQDVAAFSGVNGVRIEDSNGAVLLRKGTLQGQKISVPIQKKSPLGTITVSFSQKPLLQGIAGVLGIEAVALLLLLLATFGILWGLTRYYLNDLSALTVFIRDADSTSEQPYPGAARGDEIGLLARTLRDRDRDIAVYQNELKAYQIELEHKVTERTRELQHSKQLSETILNSIPDAISLIDVRTYTILDANTSFQNVYGLDKKSILGQACYDIRSSKHAECAQDDQKCPIEGYFECQRPVQYEHVLEAAPKSKRYLEVSAWPVQYEPGVVEQMVHVERDITEQKRVEQQRKQIEQIVRHDLKSPINGIYGMAQLLEMEEGTPSQDRCEYIRHIKGAVNKLLHMINNSMDLQQMAEGTYGLQEESLDLVQVFVGLQNDWQHLESMKSLQVAAFVEGEPLTSVQSIPLRGEKSKLESMLANLMVNALEASPPRERITVEFACESDWVTIRIHNWGQIPEDIQDRFFERYVTSGKEHGTGLGTYSARLVALSHGGDISFTTSVESGTTLLVKLPVQRG